ncbi:MAG: transposase [Acidobacteria bacterium]|nr:transposase [Acidobacteriota bacterium]
MPDPLPPIGRGKDIFFTRRRLPHWEVENGAYFVTISLHGAIPTALAIQLRDMSQALRKLKPEEVRNVRRRIFVLLERQLHTGEGVRHLGIPAVADVVTEAIHHRVRNGIWIPLEWCVMPNHLHLFIRMSEGTRPGEMDRTVSEFKRWTAHQAEKVMPEKVERFWQREWFDHWSRSEEEDRRTIAYIRDNPVKAGLVEDYRRWPYGGWNDPPKEGAFSRST